MKFCDSCIYAQKISADDYFTHYHCHLMPPIDGRYTSVKTSHISPNDPFVNDWCSKLAIELVI